MFQASPFKLLSIMNVLIISLFFYSLNGYAESIQLDDITQKKIQRILADKQHPLRSKQNKIELISTYFLNTPYQANTLIGSPSQSEILTANFNQVDCFTFIDYVYALNKSTTINNFIKNLSNIRYKNGNIQYVNRKHFFSDWYATNPINAYDITSTINHHTIAVQKKLNQKDNKTKYIQSVTITHRIIYYIPVQYIDQQTLNNLKSGDIIGIYSPKKGLDVTHVGILIKKPQGIYFRNASSLPNIRRVIDSPFMNYIKYKTGIIVLRIPE